MTKKNDLYIQQVVAACALPLIMTLGANAQDVRDPDIKALASTLGTNTSPYEPPTEYAFVVDSGPGLDTGCTYNNDPEHPLIIDIPIDRYVGEVDEEGYLKNPESLIAKGVVPATVKVTMPAYDIDVNGGPPPERDEVFLNGEHVYTLIGNNEVWEYNFFSVDIRKIKFPAAPSQVAINQVQVNVDVLSDGNWCAAIDWVALYIKIQPQIALSLKPMFGHNKIRVNDRNSEATLDIIYEDAVDGADCGTPKEEDKYPSPFSAPMGRDVILAIKLESCSEDAPSSSKVKWTWEIGGLDIGKSGETELSMPSYINIKMPDKVGAYPFSIEFAIDSETIKTVESPLFVTKAPPEGEIPRRSWYEKATSWAAGEQEDGRILSELQSGVYYFGRYKKWRYGYCFGGSLFPVMFNNMPLCRGTDWSCSWEDLIDDHSAACNHGDCHTFGRILKSMSMVLGIEALEEVMPKGSNNEGFITIEGLSSSSLDPVFSGNVRLRGDNTYNRYYFTDHNLQQLGAKFYDVTFNQTYSSETAFIDYNIIQKISAPDNTSYYTTVEGATMYTVEKQKGVGYEGWGKFEYTPPPSTRASQRKTRNAATVNAMPIRLIGSPKFQRVDTNNDGLAEVLAVEVVVEILAAGEYLFNGTVQKDGRHITDMPYYHATMPINAVLNESPGIYAIQLGLSGEDIFQSGEDGPYELVLEVTGTHFAMTPKFPTPSYKHTQFSEIGAIIKEITDAAIDKNGDGKFDFLETTVNVEVRTPGKYSLRVGMGSKDGKNTIVNAADTFILTQGTHQLKLHSPSREIRRFGLDGPYRGVVHLHADGDAYGHDIHDLSFFTQAYRAADFEVLLELDGTFKDQGIDTNDNGLFERLQIEIGVDITEAGTFLVWGTLVNVVTETTRYRRFISTKDVRTLSKGPQTLTFNIDGHRMYDSKVNGPYEFEVTIRDPNTFEDFDSVKFEQITAAYKFTDFEPRAGTVIRPISLTGYSVDKGVDTNGNGLFDELRMEVEVELTTSDFYEWSARLVDANETRVDFNSRKAWLNAGIATIDFVFDGNLIAKNGINGPYSIMGLLMAGQTGPNLGCRNPPVLV